MSYVRQTQRLNMLINYIEEEDLSLKVTPVVKYVEVVKLIIVSPYFNGTHHIEGLSTDRFIVYIEKNNYIRNSFHITKTEKGVLGRINNIIDLANKQKSVDESELI